MSGWAGVARFGGIGDNLIAASVLRPLKRLGYKVEVITNDHAHNVFLNNPFIDKLTIKKEGEIPGGEDWQKWFLSRSKEYDVFAHLSHSCEVRHGLQVAQTAFWWPPAVRRKMCAGSYLETVHDIAGVPYDFGPLYHPTDEEKRLVRNQIKDKIPDRYLVWVLRGSRLDKVYPYSMLTVARINKELGIHTVLVGAGPEQLETANLIKDHVRRQNGNRDLVHVALPQEGVEAWGVRPILALAHGASLVVSPDTGIAWACAFEPMPKVMMVSHASPENITKHWINTVTLHADPNNVPCWPCHRLHNDPSTCNMDKDLGKVAACMADISVESIVTNVAKLWKE